MEYDHETQVFNFIAGLVLGAVIGAGIAVLTAPQPGRKTRKRVRKVAGELRRTAGDRWEELSDDVKGKVEDAAKGARKRFS
jgi:gas vesicle protein